ncbi:MAG: glycosyltransferase [Clostridiaceae bacterium]|jgi:glycosyltransferase involved in cell wall biosynthesis|nr:glycosyltransferase [Clostridiaceae bacterium]
MLNLPLISFVVTSYNYEKYILKTLESIKNQTYKNFEIIVVDDKSTDNSVDIIKQFIKDNPDLKIQFIEHNENLGQLKAFQTGLKSANGQFVSFIDSDDVIVKDYAAAHLKIHMATNVAFTSAQIIEIDENDNIHTLHSPSSPQTNPAMEIMELGDLLNIDIEHLNFKILDTKSAPFGGWFWSPTSSAMFRKSAIEILLKYKETDNWKICPDKFVFNLANLIGGSAIIYAPLIGYRRHKLNAGNSTYICGNKRYNNDLTTKLNIENNIKIRPLTLKFIIQERESFYKLFGKKNTAKLFLTVVFSIFYVTKQILKF